MPLKTINRTTFYETPYGLLHKNNINLILINCVVLRKFILRDSRVIRTMQLNEYELIFKIYKYLPTPKGYIFLLFRFYRAIVLLEIN